MNRFFHCFRKIRTCIPMYLEFKKGCNFLEFITLFCLLFDPYIECCMYCPFPIIRIRYFMRMFRYNGLFIYSSPILVRQVYLSLRLFVYFLWKETNPLYVSVQVSLGHVPIKGVTTNTFTPRPPLNSNINKEEEWGEVNGLVIEDTNQSKVIYLLIY